MLERFYPDLKVDKIQDIDLDFLEKNNIKGFVLDINNTLVPEHAEEADDKALQWIEKIKKKGFKACIVSNASEKRVVRFNERLKLNAIHRASKPGRKSFLKAMELMGTKPSETAVIGDQIFTDIYGGNRLNMFTILVKPIDSREFIGVRIKRAFEGIVLASYYKNFEKSKK